MALSITNTTLHSLYHNKPIKSKTCFNGGRIITTKALKNLTLTNKDKRKELSFARGRTWKLTKSAEEDNNVVLEEQEQEQEQVQVQEEVEEQSSSSSTTVSVPVSPSDTLTMYFQAEGTMNEMVIPNVTNALEGVEGVANLKVQVVEGISSVELTKQTTVQATGVASGLVELIQGLGFKLQTLNLSFDDEEDIVLV